MERWGLGYETLSARFPLADLLRHLPASAAEEAPGWDAAMTRELLLQAIVRLDEAISTATQQSGAHQRRPLPLSTMSPGIMRHWPSAARCGARAHRHGARRVEVFDVFGHRVNLCGPARDNWLCSGTCGPARQPIQTSTPYDNFAARDDEIIFREILKTASSARFCQKVRAGLLGRSRVPHPLQTGRQIVKGLSFRTRTAPWPASSPTISAVH